MVSRNLATNSHITYATKYLLEPKKKNNNNNNVSNTKIYTLHNNSELLPNTIVYNFIFFRLDIFNKALISLLVGEYGNSLHRTLCFHY